MSTSPFETAATAASVLRERLGSHDVVLVLGSGWADVAGALGTVRASVSMAELPGFPAPAVRGHSGQAISVDASGVPLLVLAGRSHLYEGNGPETVVHGVRTAVLAGCRTVLLTNAAGSLVVEHGPGTPVVISDQLNLTGTTPMIGPEPPSDVPSRFCDVTNLYSPRLRDAARAAVPGIPEGVYAGLLGGCYETPAEIKMLGRMGADLVGMSTVLEAIAASHLGAEVFGVSLVTNLAAGLSATALDHEDVLATGKQSAARLGGLLRAVVAAA